MTVSKLFGNKKYKYIVIGICILILLVIIGVFIYMWKINRLGLLSKHLNPKEGFQTTPTPQIWLPLNDGSGTVAKDISGNLLNGTLSPTGASFTSLTSSCKSVNLNGSGYITTSFLPDLSKPFTLTMWIYTTKSGVEQPLISISDNDTTWEGGEFIFEIDTTNKLVVGQSNQFTFIGTASLNATTISANTWTHVGLVYTPPTPSKTSGTFQFYINGNLIDKRDITTVTAPASSTLTIGRYGGPAGFTSVYYYFTGNMTDFRVYNTNLSSTDMVNIYNTLALNKLSGYSMTGQYIGSTGKGSIPVLNAYAGTRTSKVVNGVSVNVNEPAFAVFDTPYIKVAIYIDVDTYENWYLSATALPASIDFNKLSSINYTYNKTVKVDPVNPVNTPGYVITPIPGSITTTQPTTTTTTTQPTTTTTTTQPTTTTTTTQPTTTTTTTQPTTTTTTTKPTTLPTQTYPAQTYAITNKSTVKILKKSNAFIFDVDIKNIRLADKNETVTLSATNKFNIRINQEFYIVNYYYIVPETNQTIIKWLIVTQLDDGRVMSNETNDLFNESSSCYAGLYELLVNQAGENNPFDILTYINSQMCLTPFSFNEYEIIYENPTPGYRPTSTFPTETLPTFPTTTYYEPVTPAYEPTTTYYEPATTKPTTVYYEPETTTTYYEPTTTKPPTVYYEPETTTTYYEPTTTKPLTVYYEPETTTTYYEPETTQYVGGSSGTDEILQGLKGT